MEHNSMLVFDSPKKEILLFNMGYSTTVHWNNVTGKPSFDPAGTAASLVNTLAGAVNQVIDSLGSAAYANIGTFPGNVAPGNHTHDVLRQTPRTLSSLPPASAGVARAVINDSQHPMQGHIGSIAVAGGSNIVPVFSDTVNWRIG